MLVVKFYVRFIKSYVKSRKNPISIPNEVSVSFNDQLLTVSGPKGKLSSLISSLVSLDIISDEIKVVRKGDSKIQKSMHGTTRQLINNMVVGVTDGFKKYLTIIGVGYQAKIQGKKITIAAWFFS